jgi:acetyl esterase/lipase
VPTTISAEAQAYLAMAAQRIAATGSLAPQGDSAATAEFVLSRLRPRAAGFVGTTETIDIGHGAKLYRVVPEGRRGRRAGVAYFDIHGGGFVTGGGEMCLILAQQRALENGVEVWAVDYRLAPEHPYPAALDDCMAAYREVLKHVAAADLVVAGGSAGGNLAAALMLRAADEGLALPAALVLMTPVTDLTGAGDTRQTNRYLDVMLYGAAPGPELYVAASDPTDPYVSPVFGSVPDGWPPTLLSSGTRDLLLSDTVRMHRLLRRAGVRAELHVTEAGPHGGFMGGAPEDRELIAECTRFCDEAWDI